MKKSVFIILISLLQVSISFPQVISSEIASINITSRDRNGLNKVQSNDPEELPEIEFIKPKIENGTMINWNENKLNILGKINSYNHRSALYLNNKEIPVSESGFFNIEQQLMSGINDLSLKAVSDNSMVNEVLFRVDFQPGLSGADPISLGKYYGLIIGINKYQDPVIPELDRPIRDAEAFYNSITGRYNFEKENVTFLKNATNTEIINALDSLAGIIKPCDNLLIFYSGHGTWDASADLGYWLPSDARKSSKLAWFRNSTLRDYLREIKSKHTLLISDACFAGSILKTRGMSTEVPKAINHLYSLPSRKAMTSGTLTDVPDESMFLKYLIERLKNNNEKYLSSEQLFSSFRIAVINNSNAVPQFGEIRDVGDQGGDFIFVLKE